jgi:hypothetical protein
MDRIAALLLFGDVPFTREQRAHNQKRADDGLGPLPWEDPKDPRFLPVPPTTEELVAQATKLITGIASSWINGKEEAKKILASFGVARLSEIPVEKLPQFIEALRQMPAGGEEQPNPDELV